MTWGALKEDWLHCELVLGWGPDMLPIVSDPTAKVSAASSLRDVGKVPSLFNGRGEAIGLKAWPQRQTTPDELAKWSSDDRLGIGLQTRRVRAIDIDIDDPAKAQAVREVVERHMIGAVRSRADSGKMLIAFEMVGLFGKQSFKCDGGLVEFLANGQQFIVAGTHPKGARYEWEGGLPDSLPRLFAEEFEALWADLEASFATAPSQVSRLSQRGDGPDLGIEDPVAEWLEANWTTYGRRAGKLDLLCPWFDNHSSDNGESQTSWLLAGTKDRQLGHFHCLHEGCRTHSETDFLDAVGYRMADFEVLPAVVDDHGREVQPRPNFKRSSPKKGYDATPSNVRMALERCDLTGMCIRYDTFRGEVMIADYPERMNWRSLKDPDYFELRVRLERMGFQQVGHDLVRQAIHWIADLQQFDTAQLWLESLPPWDGTPRIDRFLATYFGAADTAYTRAVGGYCWTAQAGRVMQPGVKADMIPVFIGEQGARKSSGVAAISPSEDFFVELGLQEKDDDMSRKMRGVLVAEIAELRGLNSRDAEGIKAWVAKRKEKWVAKYQENATLMARRLVFYGTSNIDEILADETGNRRWLPVGVGVVDVDGIERDRVQLWAEGLARWSANGVEYEAAERLGRLQHGAHRISDPWDERIERWLDEPDLAGDTPRTSGTLTVGVAMELALGLDIRSVKKADEMRVGKILRAMGLERVDKWVDGKTRKVWVDVSSPPIATSKTGGKA